MFRSRCCTKLDSLKGDTIDFAALKAAGLVENRAIRAKVVKRGEIKRAVKLKGVGATAGAKAAIEARRRKRGVTSGGSPGQHALRARRS